MIYFPTSPCLFFFPLLVFNSYFFVAKKKKKFLCLNIKAEDIKSSVALELGKERILRRRVDFKKQSFMKSLFYHVFGTEFCGLVYLVLGKQTHLK